MEARRTMLTVALLAAALLAACGERPQTAFPSHRKDSAPLYKGAEGDPFMAQHWIPGDRTSWENQIRARGQYQNEYNRTQ